MKSVIAKAIGLIALAIFLWFIFNPRFIELYNWSEWPLLSQKQTIKV